MLATMLLSSRTANLARSHTAPASRRPWSSFFRMC